MSEKVKDNVNAVDSLLKGMESYITTKTVVGEAVTIGDTIVLPLADVSFGMGVGQFSKDGNTGGMGGKITPSAVLIIQDGKSKIINIKETDNISKIADLIPDVAEKIKNKFVKNDDPIDVD